MAVQLDFFFDKLTKEERDEFFVVGCLVDVFPESLERSVLGSCHGGENDGGG
jgi:hypothetical protein